MIKFIDGALEYRGSALVIGTSLVMTEDANGVPRLDSTAGGGATDLDGLSDVTVTTPSVGHLLRHNGAGQFVNTLLVSGDLPSHTHLEIDITDLQAYLLNITAEPLSDLTDVTLTTIASGELLKWTGAAWINNTLAEAGIAAVGHTHVEADITDLGPYVLAAGGTFSGTVFSSTDIGFRIQATAPEFVIEETDASTDEGLWGWRSQGGIMSFRAINDAFSVGVNFINVRRTGTVVDAIDLLATNIRLRDGSTLRIYDSGNTDWGEWSHDGTDFNLDFTNTTFYKLNNIIGMVLSSNTTDATIKNARYGAGHYLNAQLPVMCFIMSSSSVNNWLSIGGGSQSYTSSTDIVFVTALTTTTVGGTIRAWIPPAGGLTIGSSFVTPPVDGISTDGDVKIASLGTFDSTATPVSDQVLSYNGTKWVPRDIASSFPSGDVVSGNVGDGTSVAYVDDGRTITDTPPTATPAAAPIITPVYKGVIVDMSAHTLPADKYYAVEYRVDPPGAPPLGPWRFVTTSSSGNRIVHDGLAIDGTIYEYRFYENGGTVTTNIRQSPSATGILPLATPNVMAFGVILASQLAVNKLSSITVNFGSATMDSLVVNTNILNHGDSQTLGNAYFRTLQVDNRAATYGRTITESVKITGGDLEFVGLEGEDITLLSISGNTLADPTVVTSTGHGLANGDNIYILSSNSTPSIDGFWSVLGVTTNTFTVPVNVTVAGTAGTIDKTPRTTNMLLGNYGTNRGGNQVVDTTIAWTNNVPSITTASIDTFVNASSQPLCDVNAGNQPSNDEKYTIKFNAQIDDNITSAIGYIDSQCRVTIQWRPSLGASWRTWGTSTVTSDSANSGVISQDFTVVIDTLGTTVTALDVRLTYAAVVHATKVITGTVTGQSDGSAGESVEYNYDSGGKSFTRRGMKFFEDTGEPYLYMEPIAVPPSGGNTAAGEIWFNGINNNLEFSNGVRAVTTGGLNGRVLGLIGGEASAASVEIASFGTKAVTTIPSGGAITNIDGVEGLMTSIRSGTTIGTGAGIRSNLGLNKSATPIVFEAFLRTGASITNMRWWIGLSSATQINNNSATAAGHFAGFRWDGSAMRTVTRDGTNQTATPIVGFTFATNSAYHFRVVLDGTTAIISVNDGTNNHTQNLPGTTTGLITEAVVIPTTASTKLLYFSYLYTYAGN